MKTNAKLHGLSALMAAALLTSGCARHSYMGVSLKPGGADPALQALAVKAQGGDKQAQYELGRWFEDSTDADGLKKAIRLYRIAVTPRGGSRMMSIPGASGVTTSVVSAGPKIEGNEAAQTRLRQLTLSKEIQNKSNNAAKSIKIADRQFKNDWVKLKETYSCNQFEHKPSECTYYVEDYLPIKINIQDIFDSSELIIDISGKLYCSFFCIYENQKFMISEEIKSTDPSFLHIYKSKKLVGILVRSYTFPEEKSDKLYLSSYGSRLIYSDIIKIMYSYGMSDGGEVQ